MARSFNEAFRNAREAGMKTFEFRGKSYNTKMAGEDLPKRNAPMPPVRPFVERGEDLPPPPTTAESVRSRPAVRKALEEDEARRAARAAEKAPARSEAPARRSLYNPGVTMTEDQNETRRLLEAAPEAVGYAKGGMVKKQKSKPVMKMAGGGMVMPRGYRMSRSKKPCKMS